MQKALFFIGIIAIFSGCTKYQFSKKEITETNQYGDLIGNIDINDWNIESYSSAPEKLKEFIEIEANAKFGIPAIDTIQTAFVIKKNIDNGTYKVNCSPPLFSSIAYPNPAPKDDRVTIPLRCTSKVKDGLSFITRKDGTQISGQSITIDTTGHLGDVIVITNYLVQRDDFIYYYVFVTEDDCVFWGKGDVKVGK